MREFDALCKAYEEIDALSYAAIIAEKSHKIIPALCAVTENGLDGLTLFASFVAGAVVADGNLSLEEYAITFPLFKLFFGKEVNYEDCSKIVKKMRLETKMLKQYVNDMVKVFGELSEELKEDIVLVCLMICAIDGKVSLKEKMWIKKLLK